MATWYVWNGHSGTDSGTQSNPFNTNEGIQDALDAASWGDIILVHKGDGPYKPNINFADDGSNNHIKLLRWKPNSGRPVIDGSLTEGDTYGFKVTNLSGDWQVTSVYTIVGFEIKNIRGDGPGNSYGAIYSTSFTTAHLAYLYIHHCDKGFRGDAVGGPARYSTVVSCVMKDINDGGSHGIGFYTKGNVKLYNCIAIRTSGFGFENAGANNTYNEYRHCAAIDCGLGNTEGYRIAHSNGGTGVIINCVYVHSGSSIQPDFSVKSTSGQLLSHYNNYFYSSNGWNKTAIGTDHGGTLTSNANKTENIVTGSSFPPNPVKFIAHYQSGTSIPDATYRENFRLRSGSALINSGSATAECLLDFDMIPRGHRNPGSGSILFPGGPRIGRGPASLFDDKPLHSTYVYEDGSTPQYSGMWGSSSFAIRFGGEVGYSPPLEQPSWAIGGDDGDYIDVTRVVNEIKNSSWSFFCWILGEANGTTSGDHRTILTVHASGAISGENYLDDRFIFMVESPNDSTYANMLRLQTHPSKVHGTPTNAIWDTTGAHTWRHVGVTFNLTGSVTGSTTNPHVKIYLDGELEDAIDNPEADITLEVSGSDYMLLGAQYQRAFHISINANTLGQGNHQATDMSDATFWDKALDADEVSELYNSGLPWDITQHSKYDSNIIAYYPLGDTDTISETKQANYPSISASSDLKTDIQDVSGNGLHAGSNNMQSGTFGYLFNDDGLTGSIYHYRTFKLGGVVPNSNFRLVDVGPYEYNHELPLFQGERHVSKINGINFVNGDGGDDYHRSIGKFMGVETRPARRFEAAGRLYVLSTGSHQSYDMDAGH